MIVKGSNNIIHKEGGYKSLSTSDIFQKLKGVLEVQTFTSILTPHTTIANIQHKDTKCNLAVPFIENIGHTHPLYATHPLHIHVCNTTIT